MRFNLVILLLVISLLFLEDTFGQSVYYSGNLLRIPFSSIQVNSADTLQYWSEKSFKSSSYESGSYTKYYDHFSPSSGSYFLKKSDDYYYSLNINQDKGIHEVVKQGSLNGRKIGILPGYGWDVSMPYMLSRSAVTETKNGLWLNTGAFGNAFLANNDSLIEYPLNFNTAYSFINPSAAMPGLIRAIIGKINDKYLAVFADKYSKGNLNYYLINSDDLPNLDSSKSIKVNIIGDTTFIYNPLRYLFPNYITKIKYISGDLYALTSDRYDGLSIFRYSGSSLYFVKRVLQGIMKYQYNEPPYWDIRDGKLYILSYNELISFEYISKDTSFTDRRVILDKIDTHSLFSYSKEGISNNFGIDRNLKYCAGLFKGPEKQFLDTLKIFDVSQGKYINSLVLNGIKHPFMPVIDSPYVYVHQINYQYTGVEENNKSSVKTYKLSAYPNPFNPSTTICYSIPKVSKVELVVYDILGRIVSTLVSKEQIEGEYKIQFDGSFLPSGIYIYTLQAEGFRDSKKLLLVK